MEATDADTSRRVRNLLLAWPDSDVNRYPWRHTNDPYRVLVAEFMLHRTQTVQVVPVYERFVVLYPTLADVVRADDMELMSILRPLGLQWRIRGMVEALRELWNKFGEVPTLVYDLRQVRGIGQYIAGAVVCFTRNESVTLVDTNVVRVIGRVYGLGLQGEARRRKEVIKAIGRTCDPQRPRDFYYRIIDLAHMVCTPNEPKCAECPMREVPCRYALSRSVEGRADLLADWHPG